MTVKSPKGQRTESRFLEAARQVFAEKGYSAAKIQDIADAAGRSTGSFYNYYDNKEQLLAELITQFPTEVMRDVLKRPEGADDMHEFVRSAVASYWSAAKRYLPEIIGIFHLSMSDEAFRERWRDNRAMGVKILAKDIRAVQRQGRLKGKRADLLASAIVSTLEGFVWTWLAHGGDAGVKPPSDDEAVEVLAHLWYSAVYG